MRLALMTTPRKVCTLLDVSRQWSSDCENTTVFGEQGLQSRPWLDEQPCPIVGGSTFPRSSRKSVCPTRGFARACLEKTTHLLCKQPFVKTRSFRTDIGSIHILRRTKALMQPTSIAYRKNSSKYCYIQANYSKKNPNSNCFTWGCSTWDDRKFLVSPKAPYQEVRELVSLSAHTYDRP